VCAPQVNVVQPFIPTLFAPANTNYDLGRVFAYNTPQCIGTCAKQVYRKIYLTCAGNAAVALMGTVPGYWFTIAFVEILGRVFINWMVRACIDKATYMSTVLSWLCVVVNKEISP